MKIDSAEFVRSAFSEEDFSADGLAEVAFIGRSNVGKSSLMNALLGRNGLAKTSSTPGRTRSVNYFRINRRFYFVDLPGYGYAKAGRADRQTWAQLVETYFRSRARPEWLRQILIVQLVDAKVGATKLDSEAREYMRSFDFSLTTAVTKIDRLGSNQRPKAIAGIRQALELDEQEQATMVSAHSSEGIDKIWRRIELHLRESRSSKTP